MYGLDLNIRCHEIASESELFDLTLLLMESTLSVRIMKCGIHRMIDQEGGERGGNGDRSEEELE